MHRNMTALWVLTLVLVAIASGESREVRRQEHRVALAITHGPYLQLPTSTSMTVVWHTNRTCVSRVEYGTGDDLDMTAVSSRNGLIENDRTSHVVRLAGLKPGTKYKYRVVSKEFVGYIQEATVMVGETVVSPIQEFTTLDPGKEAFSFAMVSDIHERAKDLDAMLNQKAFAGIDFAVYNGDMLNDFMKADQVFTGFLDVTIKRFAGGMPFVFARGNHETRGRFARTLPDYLPTMDGRTYYSFDHGGVHFIVLDSGEDKEDAHPHYNGLVDFQEFRKQEAEWLKADLAGDHSRNARFRIVISHIPPRGARAFAVKDMNRNFEPLINEVGIDLWLSGHTHWFQRVNPAPGQNEYPLIIGSTDSITRVDVTGSNLSVAVVTRTGDVLLAPLLLQRGRRDHQPAP